MVSNASKHAFPEDRRGTIDVQLRYATDGVCAGEMLDGGWCELSVKDNGHGIKNASEIWNSKTMGLRIVQLFTKQLGGKIVLDLNGSTHFRLRFPLRNFEFTAPPADGGQTDRASL